MSLCLYMAMYTALTSGGPCSDRTAVSSQWPQFRSSELLAKLELEDLKLILRNRRLCWFGHVECSSGAVKTACDKQIDGRLSAGRPKLTWKKLTEKTAVSGRSRQLNLKKVAPGDQV